MDILRARASVDCTTQDIPHRESDLKEKRGQLCIAVCTVERLSR